MISVIGSTHLLDLQLVIYLLISFASLYVITYIVIRYMCVKSELTLSLDGIHCCAYLDLL